MRRGLLLGMGVGLGVLAACVFEPDLSRFPPCDAAGGCPSGWACLAGENLCLPRCGEQGPCGDAPPSEEPADGGTVDGGADGDAGGGDGGAPDAGPPPLVLQPEAPGDSVETMSFSHRFQVRGGTPPYAFTLVGEPPPGLALDGEGVLAGRPTQAGTFPFDIEVADQGTPVQRMRLSFSLQVRALLRVAGPGILADFLNGRAYVEPLSATGGSSKYTFELVPGSVLPAGLVLYANGEVRGTSSATGGATFQVQVTDDAPRPQVAIRTLQLTASSCTLSGTLCLRSRSVPDARVGDAYAYTLLSAFNTGSVTWKVESGVLPPGLSLQATTGVLSGTPTRADEYAFTLSVADVFDKRALPVVLKVY